ncbi:hypothetical protein AVEN_21399-1 [Araneus ventricosus]|uniref:Uncharacterized protein n=1 Tax=Araneus ventricosus TaxID=182803 RepID=A0A4Y2LLK8_ARAVE|nr:hypothetical protein AVEN_21399-1 [Araneus ventricosus]
MSSSNFCILRTRESKKEAMTVQVLRCPPQNWRAPSWKPDSWGYISVLGLLHAISYVGHPTSSRWCAAEVWRGGASSGVVPSYDRGSKLRDPSQNSPRVVSKRVVNITELNK